MAHILQVIWNRLYSTSSAMDGATLYQLRNVINRRNVTKDPTKNVAACEEFFSLVAEAHILAAAVNVFGMNSLDSTPSCELFPQGCIALSSQERRKVLMSAAHKVLDQFVDISFGSSAAETPPSQDHVNEYACDVMTLGLFLMAFTDVIREGDGTRILRCWKYFMLIFREAKRKNYSIEAFTMLAQQKFLFSPRMSKQLLWCRTVNVHGRPGKNIPCDLHMEHLNRVCKESISGLGANITDHSIQRAGRSVGRCNEILANLDELAGVRPESDYHTVRSSQADLQKILQQLTEERCVFDHRSRCHRAYPKFQANVMKKLDRIKLELWMKTQLQKLITYNV